jgi:ribonucleoside-diphosphate reductase alpha chain
MSYRRPKVLTGVSRRVEVGCGSLYVTMNSDNGNLVEVIANLGKAGSCAGAQNEAIGRLLSLCLKSGVSIEDCIEQLRDIKCPNPKEFPKEERCLSCADGFARALGEWNGNHKKNP